MKVVIPAYARHGLTRRVLKYYKRLGADARVVESPDVDGHVSGVAYALCENWPLGTKFNRAIQLATRTEGSALIVGSDCLVSQGYIDFTQGLDAEYMEVRGCHFFNSTTGEMVYSGDFACGSGKYLGESLLKTCGYAPYDWDAIKNVDNGPRKYLLGSRSVHWSLPYDPVCVEIRTATQMWSWQWVLEQATEKVDADLVFEKLGEAKEDWMGL